MAASVGSTRTLLTAALAGSAVWLGANLVLFPVLAFLFFALLGGNQPAAAHSAFSTAILCAAPLSAFTGLLLSIATGRWLYRRQMRPRSAWPEHQPPG